LYGDHRTRRTGKRVAALYGEVLTAREVTQALA
jgi:hypothetical protein